MTSKYLLGLLATVVGIAPCSMASAALVFAINGQEGTVPAVNLGQGNPSTNLTIQIRRDDLDSGGDHLASFAFRVRSSDPSVAQFTAASLTSPGNLTSSSAVANGATATASGTYLVRPIVHFESPGSYVNLATFTLTGVYPGSVSISIEELTIDALSGGPNDFTLGAATGPVVGQDRTGFSGNGSVIGTASTTIGAISTVPEPASLSLCGAVMLLGAFAKLRHSRRAGVIVGATDTVHV